MASGTAVLRCPYHPDDSLIEDHAAGDMICPQCGLVVGDRVIDVGSEWRTFSNEKSATDRSRVGQAELKMAKRVDVAGNLPLQEDPFLEGRDLTTYIGTVSTKPGTAGPSNSFSKWQKGGMSAADRSLTTASREISNMVSKLNLPKSIEDRCKMLYKEVHEQKQLKGRANDAVAAACLFISCRQEEVPRSFKEICAVSRHSKKEIGRCYKLIRLVTDQAAVPAASTSDFMSRFCTNLQLPSYVQKAASHIAEKAVQKDLAPGRVYLSVAAAAIYMASQASEVKKTQKEVGDVVGVADSTIRQSYRLLYPAREELFPTDFKFVTPLDQLPKH